MTHCNTCQENHDDPCRGIYDLDTRLLELRDERIAQLEAELADIDHALRHEFCADDMHAARALLAGKKKAEAEVERLKEHLAKHCPPGLEDICVDLRGEASP